MPLPFAKGSMAWRVNMEPVIGLGGGKALLMQVLHPQVAAGVADHSNFAADPFRRGFRTADTMLKLAFADARTSAKQADLLHKMHERVKGSTYNALDPALLVWVWATLVDVSLVMYERAVRTLTDDERERYYQEQKLIAYACGVPEGGCPETSVDFAAYFERMQDSLAPTEVAEIVAFAGRNPPMPHPLDWIAGPFVTFLTAGLLPERFRATLGYEWSTTRERALSAFFLASRIAARVVPRPVRHLPNRYLIKRKRPLGWWKNRSIELSRPAGT